MRPALLTNYEVGTRAGDVRPQAQARHLAYYMQWTNVQQFLYNPTYGLNNTVGIDYDIKEIGTSIIAKPLQGWTLNNSFSYNLNTQSSSPCIINKSNPATATDANTRTYTPPASNPDSQNTLLFNTAPYRPAVFTSKDDDAVRPKDQFEQRHATHRQSVCHLSQSSRAAVRISMSLSSMPTSYAGEAVPHTIKIHMFSNIASS